MSIRKIPLRLYKDKRGWLIENEDQELKDSMRHFLVSTLKSGQIRGQHYHLKKKEWFLVVKGKVKMVFKDIGNGDIKEINVSERKPEIVVAEPKIAHAFKNIGKTEAIIIAIVNEPLDKNHPDTYPYVVT